MATSWKDLLSSFDTKRSPLRQGNPNVNKQRELENVYNYNIIYTDTSILAKKFMVSMDTVIGAFNTYITAERARGYQWILLDAFSDLYGNGVFRHNGWESYANYLSDFFHKNGIVSNIHTSVFIVGGDDVIPIPRHRIQVDDAPIGFEVEMDMFYCFKPGVKVTSFLNSVKIAGPNGVNQVLDNIQCNIGRLPIETGNLSLSFQESVISYLKRCSDTNMCIRVNNSINVSVDDWADATDFIVNGIPSAVQGFETSFVNNKMFIVPSYSINEQAMRSVFELASQKCDMALFNLHGAVQSQQSQYYGDNGAEAFSPDLAEKCNAKLICSLACYGARYTGYAMSRSILLSSLWRNCFLFIGSCQPSFFSNWRRGYCEILIKEFLLNLFKGIPAGEALLMAKISYLLKYWPMDNFSSAYLTVGEFNVFGNPGLVIKTEAVNVMRFDYETNNVDLYSSDKHELLGFSNSSIAELDEAYIEVQENVNNSIIDIEHQLSNKLCSEFSMENVRLCSSLRRKNIQGLSGYKFIYTFGLNDEGVAILKTDDSGKIIDLVRTR
ncbi:hypothetical protein [uncultured Rikenella sp.]|uniref:hypothetical protein n=1 Tax=uncultured Rikenella sp. TaxID=368003 RepID=UPI0026133666|nr:hypothetical protein [uncultured Rikenella sp.]